MIVEIYVDGRLLYDNRLPEESGYLLSKAEIMETLNKGGTLTICLPPSHPLRGSWRPYSVPVEVYKDGCLRWRGRPLPAKCNLYLQNTIVCEGEFCFLNDAVMRPYSYEDPPADIFRDAIRQYNSAMADEPWKQFVIGSVTVDGDDLQLESDSPKKVREVVEELIEEADGYIIFDSAPDGRRRINYLAQLPYTCNQAIQLGSNLTDFSSGPDNPDFATRLVPFGAVGDNEKRLTINVNGKDYVENVDAVRKYGVIETHKTYNDIESKSELQAQAQRDIDAIACLPSIVDVSAVDLSRQDASLDAFQMGQVVRCYSQPHEVDGTYALLSLKEDLIDPKTGKVTLSYESVNLSRRTLSGAVAAGMKKSEAAARSADTMIRTNLVRSQASLDEAKHEMQLAACPINACIQIYGHDNPAVLFGGGKWERVAGYLRGCSEIDAIGPTGEILTPTAHVTDGVVSKLDTIVNISTWRRTE